MSVWYGIWYGYAFQSVLDDDVERFQSLEHAKEALHDRDAVGATLFQSFDYVRKEPERVLTPAVKEDSEILLFSTPDTNVCPTRRVFFGPRGGVRVEHL